MKARINEKMKRASYKCLDDLIEDGLPHSILENLDQTERYLKMIHGKDNMGDISIEMLTRLSEPW